MDDKSKIDPLTPHLRYLVYLLRHKWFVFVAGLSTGAPLWRLLIHDWSKFLLSEWSAYVGQFYSGKPDQNAFDNAWLFHQRRNAHHWQFWVLLDDHPPSSGRRFGLQSMDDTRNCYLCRTGSGCTEGVELVDTSVCPESPEPYRLAKECVDAANRYRALPMPEIYVREMVADWMGAGRAIHGHWEIQEWYDKNRQMIVLHPQTRTLVESILAEVVRG